jgi:REP element-mobilizing transposase RayT
MVHYRRNRVPGASYFFTVALEDRSSRLLVVSIDCFRHAYATALRQHPFQTIAIAILPDHLHAIWQLPEADSDYSRRWRALKSTFVHDFRRGGLHIPINDKGGRSAANPAIRVLRKAGFAAARLLPPYIRWWVGWAGESGSRSPCRLG